VLQSVVAKRGDLAARSIDMLGTFFTFGDRQTTMNGDGASKLVRFEPTSHDDSPLELFVALPGLLRLAFNVAHCVMVRFSDIHRALRDALPAQCARYIGLPPSSTAASTRESMLKIVHYNDLRQYILALDAVLLDLTRGMEKSIAVPDDGENMLLDLARCTDAFRELIRFTKFSCARVNESADFLELLRRLAVLMTAQGNSSYRADVVRLLCILQSVHPYTREVILLNRQRGPRRISAAFPLPDPGYRRPKRSRLDPCSGVGPAGPSLGHVPRNGNVRSRPPNRRERARERRRRR
jgi:hypothetical protein